MRCAKVTLLLAALRSCSVSFKIVIGFQKRVIMEAQTIGRTHRRTVMIEVVIFSERQSDPKYIRIYMDVTSWLL